MIKVSHFVSHKFLRQPLWSCGTFGLERNKRAEGVINRTPSTLNP